MDKAKIKQIIEAASSETGFRQELAEKDY